MLKKAFLSHRNLIYGFPSWYYYIDFLKNALNPKSRILATYACGHTVHCMYTLTLSAFPDKLRQDRSGLMKFERSGQVFFLRSWPFHSKESKCQMVLLRQFRLQFYPTYHLVSILSHNNAFKVYSNGCDSK